MAAKRNFEIRIYGEGGHGSMPHLNIDPIVCAAAVVQSLQTVVSRNMNPLDAVVLSINMINGGSATNLVVDQVVMRGTVRSLSEQALDHAIERADAITEKTAQAYECRCQILWDEKIPAVYNSPEMTSQARIFAGMTGYEVIDAVPSLASEDYAMYQSYAPSFFYWVGSRAKEESQIEELHRPRFHTDDTALAGAAQVLAISAIGVSKI
jgi:hippurate hydrolase